MTLFTSFCFVHLVSVGIVESFCTHETPPYKCNHYLILYIVIWVIGTIGLLFSRWSWYFLELVFSVIEVWLMASSMFLRLSYCLWPPFHQQNLGACTGLEMVQLKNQVREPPQWHFNTSLCTSPAIFALVGLIKFILSYSTAASSSRP